MQVQRSCRDELPPGIALCSPASARARVTVVSDTSPKQISGLSGALFNTFGNVAAITTPIAIGYIVGGTGSFAWALVFVAANAIAAIAIYLFVVGDIKRVVLSNVRR